MTGKPEGKPEGSLQHSEGKQKDKAPQVYSSRAASVSKFLKYLGLHKEDLGLIEGCYAKRNPDDHSGAIVYGSVAVLQEAEVGLRTRYEVGKLVRKNDTVLIVSQRKE